jgi:ubiquinone/menaquinone biosynthesis C-methylase UbiE
MRLTRVKQTNHFENEAARSPESIWFWDHYEWAAGQVLEFLDGAGFSPAGRAVADVGCGDGILTLGLARRLGARRVVGFDINPVDVSYLTRRAQEEGVPADLPRELEFCVCEPERLPADSNTFDLVSTWSAFEHVADPLSVLGEIRRVLRPEGILYLQLWPFYFSERGSHLWEWFSQPFHHLFRHQAAIIEALQSSDLKSREWTDVMAREFSHLNRITLDELQRCILAAGMSVVKLELLTNPVIVPPELARYSLADLGVTGVKLLAVPAPRR